MIRFLRSRLQYKLIIAFIVVLLIPAAITSAYNYFRTSEILIGAERFDEVQLALSQANNAKVIITEARSDILFLSQTPQLRRFVNADNRSAPVALRDVERLLLAFMSRSTDIYKGACVLNTSGQEVACVQVSPDGKAELAPSDTLKNQQDKTYFTSAYSLTNIAGLVTSVYISGVELEDVDEAEATYQALLRYSTPLRADGGGERGVLVLNVALDPIFDALTQNAGNRDVYVVDAQGNYILHPDRQWLAGQMISRWLYPDTPEQTPTTLLTDRPIDSSVILSSNNGAFFGSQDHPDQASSFARIQPVGRVRWFVIYDQPLNTILGSVQESQLVIFGIGLLGLVIAVIVAVLITRSITRPILQLAQAAESISQGQWDTPLPQTRSVDEIGTLVGAFREMAGRIETRTRELIRANALAKESARLKSEFMSTMSHELRTPLNAILGFCGIMLEGMGGEFDDEARHMLDRIYSNSNRLLHLINEVLDLAKIESGRMEITQQPLPPRSLANQWQAQMNVLAIQKGLQFETYVAPDMPDIIYCDPERVTQIAVNLLSNAFKFTERGSVKLSIERQETTWTLAVTDTGIGIPPHAINYIFDEFRQLDGSSKRVYGGSGLGLAIVRNLCMMMDGNVKVVSTLGEGSTFTVTLPLVTQPQTEAEVLEKV
jgi:signal transduction histidine kinase